ncbi:MAG: ABC transporter ATP-binding protein [Candidatus Brocadiia bacterium]
MTANSDSPIVELRDVWKTYEMGEVDVHALRGVSLAIYSGQMVAIMGPSGSGKSTMLNLLGCLDRPTTGHYRLGNRDVSDLSDNELSEVRASRLGFIFQSYNLIPQLNVTDNIEIPLYYLGLSEHESYQRAVELARQVGLGHRLKHLPAELSGGQQQRVSIARALVSNPLLLLADEPTGNLDTKTGAEILKLLKDLNDRGTTLVMVTHDPNVAEMCEQTYHLVDGRLENHDMHKLPAKADL